MTPQSCLLFLLLFDVHLLIISFLCLSPLAYRDPASFPRRFFATTWVNMILLALCSHMISISTWYVVS